MDQVTGGARQDEGVEGLPFTKGAVVQSAEVREAAQSSRMCHSAGCTDNGLRHRRTNVPNPGSSMPPHCKSHTLLLTEGVP